MSQREMLLVLAHAHGCTACRERLLRDPAAALRGHALSEAEKDVLARLSFDDFITPDLLARAAGTTLTELDAYRDQPVARLRHL